MPKKKLLPVILVCLLCCGIMTWVDGWLRPGYAVKSAIKITLFLLLPLLATKFCGLTSVKTLLQAKRKGVFVALGLGVGLYGLILGGYFLVRPYFDFSNIAASLTANAGVTKDNFLFVSLYISFVNSLLEEFFFRGFVFGNLRSGGKWLSYGFSAAAFALYHVAMMAGWFQPLLFLLVMVGLMAGGVIFNLLNEKLETLYGSWLVHMFANFAINTIGFLLLSA